MIYLIPLHTAQRVLLSILCITVLFHVLVLTGIIPFTIVWGGKMKDYHEMVQFESISIGVNILMLLAVFMHMKIISIGNHPVKIRVLFITMTILFSLNTLGNVFAESVLEKLIFTPITLLSAILCWRLSQKD